MCFCDPQSSCQFSDGGVPLHQGKEWTEREREGEGKKHPWLFTKHSLFYLREAVRGLPSPLHLSLISDKALFKCLLSWPIHDWRWHLRNTSEECRGISGVGGSGRVCAWSFLFLSEEEPLIRFSTEEAVSTATAPFSDSSVSRWREFTPGWWAQWVITFSNENHCEIARRAKQRQRERGESPVQRDKRRDEKRLNERCDEEYWWWVFCPQKQAGRGIGEEDEKKRGVKIRSLLPQMMCWQPL